MELLKFIATQTTCAIDDRNKNMHALTAIVELKSVDAERECVTTVVLTSTSGGGRCGKFAWLYYVNFYVGEQYYVALLPAGPRKWPDQQASRLPCGRMAAQRAVHEGFYHSFDAVLRRGGNSWASDVEVRLRPVRELARSVLLHRRRWSALRIPHRITKSPSINNADDKLYEGTCWMCSKPHSSACRYTCSSLQRSRMTSGTTSKSPQMTTSRWSRVLSKRLPEMNICNAKSPSSSDSGTSLSSARSTSSARSAKLYYACRCPAERGAHSRGPST